MAGRGMADQYDEPELPAEGTHAYYHHAFTVMEQPDGWCHVRWNRDTQVGTPIYDARFDRVEDFMESVACVAKDGKEFHIKPDGTPAYEARYIEVLEFRYGAAVVRDERGWFHINHAGEAMIEKRYADSYMFFEGVASVTEDGKDFHIDLNGKALYAERYDFAEPFQHEGFAFVEIGFGPDKERFKIDKTGKRIA